MNWLDVCLWHGTDIKLRPLFGRCGVESGHHRLVMSLSAFGPGCVKTQKFVERRERFFQNGAKSDALANFCAPKRDFAKCPFYRIRSPRRFSTAKTHSGRRRGNCVVATSPRGATSANKPDGNPKPLGGVCYI
jgi:hypothetical protein